MRLKNGLTIKQNNFVKEYRKDWNGTQAVIRAGYISKRADQMAYELLRKPEIQQALANAAKKDAAKEGVTPEWLIRQYKLIAQVDIAKCYDENGNLRNIHDIPEDTRLALAALDVFEEFAKEGKKKIPVGQTKKIKMWDKLKALDGLGRHLGLFNADTSQKAESPIIILMREIDGKGIPEPSD